MQDLNGSATYSPEDNKIRMTFPARLPKEIYLRVRAEGFIWAPKQELFVAPMWTPGREDLAIRLCGEIGDEDKSLVERAEERAERFEDYSASRAADADAAHKTVEGICEHIPLGQPILVGHHSERRARKDAERIENGMRRAVKMWETSKYWTDRAESAIRHAKYLERADVRARRIKGIEADKRKQERNKAEAEQGLRFWRGEMKLVNRATGDKFQLEISEANRAEIVKVLGGVLGNAVGCYLPKKEGDTLDHASAYSCLSDSHPTIYAPRTVEECRVAAEKSFTNQIAWAERWLAHYENRLAYERAMLAAGGGLVATRQPIGVGGRVLRRGQWFPVLKVNMRNGELSSVTVSGHWKMTISADEIQDYKPPQEGDFEKVKDFAKLPPLCNYPGEGFATITQKEWDEINSDYKGQGRRAVIAGNDKAGSHRVRVCLGEYAALPPEPEEEKRKPFYCSSNYSHRYWHVFITDAKVKMPPAPDIKPPAELPKTEPKETIHERAARYIEADKIRAAAGADSINADTLELHFDTPPAINPKPENSGAKFEAMKETLKAGVQIVTAPQLFPTPPELAARMAELADLKDGICVLEPSAGTGNLVQAVRELVDTEIVGVEINRELCGQLSRRFPSHVLNVRCADFLALNGDLGQFERIVMNPPFSNGADIKHILHAREHLAEGGKLVALCANGPRQREALQPIASSWEDLPAGSFKEAGTGVNVALLTIDA